MIGKFYAMWYLSSLEPYNSNLIVKDPQDLLNKLEHFLSWILNVG